MPRRHLGAEVVTVEPTVAGEWATGPPTRSSTGPAREPSSASRLFSIDATTGPVSASFAKGASASPAPPHSPGPKSFRPVPSTSRQMGSRPPHARGTSSVSARGSGRCGPVAPGPGRGAERESRLGLLPSAAPYRTPLADPMPPRSRGQSSEAGCCEWHVAPSPGPAYPDRPRTRSMHYGRMPA